jgi:hypothetical protein
MRFLVHLGIRLSTPELQTTPEGRAISSRRSSNRLQQKYQEILDITQIEKSRLNISLLFILHQIGVYYCHLEKHYSLRGPMVGHIIVLLLIPIQFIHPCVEQIMYFTHYFHEKLRYR